MDQLMIALMVWISAASDLPAAPQAPSVEFNTPQELHELNFPGTAYRAESGAPQAVALYDLDGAVVHLPDGWQVSDPVDLSILVHELVHHMQASAGLEYQCRGAMEKVAYDTQIAFLESMGLDMFEVMEINELFYRIITSCGLT